MYKPYENVKTCTMYTFLEWCKLDKKSIQYHSQSELEKNNNGVWI